MLTTWQSFSLSKIKIELFWFPPSHSPLSQDWVNIAWKFTCNAFSITWSGLCFISCVSNFHQNYVPSCDYWYIIVWFSIIFNFLKSLSCIAWYGQQSKQRMNRMLGQWFLTIDHFSNIKSIWKMDQRF